MAGMEEEQTTARSAHRSPADERSASDEPNTLLNGLVGAVVTVLTAPLLPFAAIFGGGVAGYLQQGDFVEGAKVGAISGAIAAIPAFFLVWLVVGFFLLGMDPVFALGSFFAVVVFVFVVGYLVGAGALGGALGVYVRREL
jgi:hypothetical protein